MRNDVHAISKHQYQNALFFILYQITKHYNRNAPTRSVI